MCDVTKILDALGRGDPEAAGRLWPLVYDELRVLAARWLSRERPGQTLQATALVHEAYLRLLGDDPDRPWDNRGHFFAAAAESMRRILVDNARRKQAAKRGGGHDRVGLTDAEPAAGGPAVDPVDLLALDEALDRLAALDPVKAELVKLRYFAGLSVDEAAAALGMARATANRHWAFARAWLFRAVEGGEPE